MVMGPPALATPHPLSDEWWFSAWGVEKDVWPLTRGAGVTVAVLDSGVNASLPELSGVVLKGSDTTGRKSDGRKDFDDKDGGHGTGLSALIAGQGGGSTGFVGIAPEAKILPINVNSRPSDPVGLYEAIAAGIRFAVNHNAKVINISLGITSGAMPNHCESGIQDAISYAIDHDVMVVASSGNEGNKSNWPDLPGSCAGVLAVGAIVKTLNPWSDSQRQPYVAIAAPGVGGVVGRHGQYYPHASGTSISAALTSGAAALIRSRNPHMPARTVVQRLMATAYHTKSSPWNDQTGYGPIQITSAMNPERYPVPANAPNPVYDAFDKWQASRYGAAPKAPTKPTRPAPEQARKPSRQESSTLPIVLGAVGALVIAGIVILGIRRRRRSRGSSPAVTSQASANPFQNP
jgi:type VII secretion-associated serine protease mycosin